jgi:hypothetical protein
LGFSPGQLETTKLFAANGHEVPTMSLPPASFRKRFLSFVSSRKTVTAALIFATLFVALAHTGRRQRAETKKEAVSAVRISAAGADSRAAHRQLPPNATQSPERIWKDVDFQTSLAPEASDRGPKSYRALELDKLAMARVLAEVPMQFTPESRDGRVLVTLPSPDGRDWDFVVEESPVLGDELRAQHPDIKTYRGRGVQNPEATARFSLTPQGFQAYVISARGSYLIAPEVGQSQFYKSYYTHDLPEQPVACHVSSGRADSPDGAAANDDVGTNVPLTGATLRTYRLVVAVTPEFVYNVAREQTPSDGTISAVIAYVNRVNAIYEREAGIFFSLLQVRYPVAYNFPLLDGDLTSMNQENQRFWNAFYQNPSNYDLGVAIGHDSRGPSGLANFGDFNQVGGACQNGYKAQTSVKIQGPYEDDYWGTSVFAHELGHMFGARHTFTVPPPLLPAHRNRPRERSVPEGDGPGRQGGARPRFDHHVVRRHLFQDDQAEHRASGWRGEQLLPRPQPFQNQQPQSHLLPPPRQRHLLPPLLREDSGHGQSPAGDHVGGGARDDPGPHALHPDGRSLRPGQRRAHL